MNPVVLISSFSALEPLYTSQVVEEEDSDLKLGGCSRSEDVQVSNVRIASLLLAHAYEDSMQCTCLSHRTRASIAHL